MMENKNLIEKLEKVSLPKIEIASHKKRLKLALINEYFREERKGDVFNIVRKLAPLGAIAVVLVALIFNNLIFPKYSIAEAEKIALNDPQVKEWTEKGSVIKDTEIIDNKAYILIQPQKEIQKAAESLKTETSDIKEEFAGALIEVDFKGKKVSKIEKIVPEITSLTEKEQERVKEISTNDPEVNKIIPKEASILKIKTTPPSMKLKREDDSVSVVPESNTDREVKIIYEYNQNQWESKIDLNKEEVKSVNFLGEVPE
jgi:hypothetical protein